MEIDNKASFNSIHYTAVCILFNKHSTIICRAININQQQKFEISKLLFIDYIGDAIAASRSLYWIVGRISSPHFIILKLTNHIDLIHHFPLIKIVPAMEEIPGWVASPVLLGVNAKGWVLSRTEGMSPTTRREKRNNNKAAVRE